MLAKDHFKSIARTARRVTQGPNPLPSLKRSASPSTRSKQPQSPSTREISKRSNSTERLPDLKNSKSGSRSSANFENAKSSDRPCGVVKSFAVNTDRGRHHNEDRVSIIMNIQCPSGIEESIWPSSSFYGLYDGHSGKSCAEYLKQNLSDMIFKDQSFPRNTKQAISSGFLKCDQIFLMNAKENAEMSGSCALVVMFIGDKCFVGNTGDSRVIISIGQGKAISAISSEHRPGETTEYNRIIEAGGKVYNNYILNDRGENVNLGPHLVAPGRLKVSRALGDIDAKDPEYGGNPKVIIPDPQVKSFPVRSDQDFMFMATSSVFEKLSNREICEIVYKTVHAKKGAGVGSILLSSLEEIFNEAIARGCEENMTGIIIGLRGLKKLITETSM